MCLRKGLSSTRLRSDPGRALLDTCFQSESELPSKSAFPTSSVSMVSLPWCRHHSPCFLRASQGFSSLCHIASTGFISAVQFICTVVCVGQYLQAVTHLSVGSILLTKSLIDCSDIFLAI